MAWTNVARALSMATSPKGPAWPRRAGKDREKATIRDEEITVTPNPIIIFSRASKTTPANTLARNINVQSVELSEGLV